VARVIAEPQTNTPLGRKPWGVFSRPVIAGRLFRLAKPNNLEKPCRLLKLLQITVYCFTTIRVNGNQPMSGPGIGSFDFQNRDNDDDVHLHERIRRVYDALKANSTLDNRNRLVVASMPLIHELARRFVKQYPRLKQDQADLESLAAAIVAEAALDWVDSGKFPKADIAAFICKLVWDAMRHDRIENRTIRVPRNSLKKPQCADDAARARAAKYLTESDFDIGPKQASHSKAVIDANAAIEIFPPCSLIRNVVLGVLNGLTNRQIAVNQGVSATEVGNKKREAIAELKKQYGDCRLRIAKPKPRKKLNKKPRNTETHLATGA
jgi:hypothetical protein